MDNYEVAMETAEKCCQANAQFAEISEVMSGCSDTRAAPELINTLQCHSCAASECLCSHRSLERLGLEEL